ncbi:uncharacterized protein ACH125_000942 [Urocitellus parryii]
MNFVHLSLSDRWFGVYMEEASVPQQGSATSQGLTRALSFERPCFLRGGICLKRGAPNCEPFRGPWWAFTVCCKIRSS